MRKLTVEERKLLTKLLQVEFTGHETLILQLEGVVVEELGPPNAPYLRLVVSDDAPLADVARRVPIEAVAPDADGMTIHFLVHVLEGRLSELEIFREDSKEILSVPPADAVQVLKYP